MILDLKNKHLNVKNILKLLLTIAISLFFIVYALKDFNYNSFIDSINNAKFFYIYLSIIILLITIQLRAIRWHFLFKGNVKVNNLYVAQLIGYMGNNLLPLRFGEFLKSFYLEKKLKISKFKVFGTVVLERFLDLTGILLLVLIIMNTNLYNKLSPYYINFILLIFLVSLLAIIFSIYFKSPKNIKSSNRIFIIISDVIHGFSSLAYNNVLYVFIMTLLIWINYVIVVYLVQYAFSFNLDIYQSILLLLLPSLALSIPSLPGNIGTFEGAVVYTLSLYGIEDTIGFGFILHSISFIPYTLLGLIYFAKERKIIFNE
tara:strand:- start:24 stop:971 length:948 start_codon:yes stop_codon:yes gene_type:complete